MIIPYPTVEVKHIWQLYVISQLRIKLGFFTILAMVWIFIVVKNIFKSFGCTKICSNSKWTKTSWNEVMQPTTSINDSPLIFPYRVLNQAGFGNPFISQREFICLGISQMSFTFYVFARVQGSISIKAARKANIGLQAHYCRYLEATFQTFWI